ncbi:MAG TPA: LLM class F420-dependent oxidoreductase [Mycobacteriales bacterium]|nr:LLM class F420-dependent oxidoreductase [Mycobacteriales bacterium]
MSATGLALPLNLALPVAGFVDVAARAEAAGYDRLWAAEAGNNDAFGLLTAVALGTSTVQLATGVVPIYTRTPALMAQCAATLQDVSGGRFTLGLGVSSATIVSKWNGVEYDAPLARLREYVPLVRRLLAGERLDEDGRYYRVQGYGLLMHVPSPPSPILIGALNEGMLRAGGEVADGVCLNWIGAQSVAAALAHVTAGPRETRNACFVRVCVTEDVDAVRRFARREVMGYVTVPAYRRAFEVQGWGAVTAAAMELWDAGDRKGAAASLPAEFLDSLVLAGPAAEVRARFQEFRAAGVDEPVAFLVSGQSEPAAVRAELEATIAALAPARRTV